MGALALASCEFGEMPGFLRYGCRAVGTTVVPPNLPGSTLRPAVRLAGVQAYFVRVLRSPDWDRRVRRTHPFFVACLGYASTVCTSSGARGWIPAGDKGAHQGAQDLRGVRFVDRYIFWGRWMDSFRRKRSSTRSRGSKRDSPGSLPSAIVAATASCMERVIGIGQMRKMGGSTDQARRAKERGTEPDGVNSVWGAKGLFFDVSAFHGLLGWSSTSIALHLLLDWFPSGDRVG